MAESIEQKYAKAGYPSVEELKKAQGTIPTADPRELFGAWPEEEDIDDFLAALREWRGENSDRAA